MSRFFVSHVLLVALVGNVSAEQIRQTFTGTILRVEGDIGNQYPNAEIGDAIEGVFHYYSELSEYAESIYNGTGTPMLLHKFGKHGPPMPIVRFSGYTVSPQATPDSDGMVQYPEVPGFTLLYGEGPTEYCVYSIRKDISAIRQHP